METLGTLGLLLPGMALMLLFIGLGVLAFAVVVLDVAMKVMGVKKYLEDLEEKHGRR